MYLYAIFEILPSTYVTIHTSWTTTTFLFFLLFNSFHSFILSFTFFLMTSKCMCWKASIAQLTFHQHILFIQFQGFFIARFNESPITLAFLKNSWKSFWMRRDLSFKSILRILSKKSSLTVFKMKGHNFLTVTSSTRISNTYHIEHKIVFSEDSWKSDSDQQNYSCIRKAYGL